MHGQTASEALSDSLKAAQKADELGYHRYWAAEHHNTKVFASVAPEIFIPALAAVTTNIRIGAGGIMLPNYAPLKVAEQFLMMEQLHPGRIDLSVGRAFGTDLHAARALMGPGPEHFGQMLQMMLMWLRDASGLELIKPDSPLTGIKAGPDGSMPDIWMLSSSAESAAFAGGMGLKLAYSDLIGQGGAKAALEAYHKAFKPSDLCPEPYCAVSTLALTADSDEEAEYLAGPVTCWGIALRQNRPIPFPSLEEAQNQLMDYKKTPEYEQARSRGYIGEGRRIREKLLDFGEEIKANEVFFMIVAPHLGSRFKTLQDLAL